MASSTPTPSKSNGGYEPSTVPTGAEKAERLPGERTLVRRFAGFVARHPMGILRAIGAALLIVVILQNVEPTSVRVLFWQIAQLPKIVLILVSIALGGVLWEISRRSLGLR
ncbi:MAG TPA: LapA family protein [Myxococcota bacterium]|nr:LapA family protein [Myxococcota bacterium]